MTFEIERIYHRRHDIHDVFGGQRQGGISTPDGAPHVFLFTGETGEQHGYHDGFEGNGVFVYTGEGQRGPMEFVRGNKAIRDHTQAGKDLLLFEATKRKGYYRHKGTFVCAGYDDTQMGPDTDKNQRKLIRFQLVPMTVLTELSNNLIEENEPNPNQVPIADLRQRAYEAVSSPVQKDTETSKRSLYQRSKAVKKYVLARANGICECCKTPAPFKKKNGAPYLEPHHIRQLSDDGLDSPIWVGAVCPTCHREIHHGLNGELKNEILKTYINLIEK